jgi:hypothetical protein
MAIGSTPAILNAPARTRLPIRHAAWRPGDWMEQRSYAGDTAGWDSGVVRRRWRGEGRGRRRLPGALHQSHVSSGAARAARRARGATGSGSAHGAAGADAIASAGGTARTLAATAASNLNPLPLSGLLDGRDDVRRVELGRDL